MWKIEYGNDVSENDDCFWQWWDVSDGEVTFKADSLIEAEWLAKTLNATEGKGARL
jgi:hypothetical protein